MTTGNSNTAAGGAIFDPQKRIIVSTSGSYNSGMSLKVSTLKYNVDDIKGETKLISSVIPFGTVSTYPFYDGEKWVYFFKYGTGSNNRFGRLDISELDKKDFKELPRMSSGYFCAYSSAVFHFGNIYAINNNGYKLWRYVVSVSTCYLLPVHYIFCFFFIGKPLGRTPYPNAQLLSSPLRWYPAEQTVRPC